MKNIFLIPTPYQCRFQKLTSFEKGKEDDVALTSKGEFFNNGFHMYIVSDKLFQEKDWVLNTDTEELYKANNDDVLVDKKDIECYADFNLQVILTTDPTLIATGVQAIDDEFLEWFVKNPTREFVELETYCCRKLSENYCDLRCGKQTYKIIIPQEEPKQEFLLFDKERANTITSEGQKTVRELQNTIQQETLEEAAKEYMKGWGGITNSENSFIEGAKWQAEQELEGYLQGFIDQFSDGKFGELDGKEWNALGFLSWLKLNKFEIIKKK